MAHLGSKGRAMVSAALELSLRKTKPSVGISTRYCCLMNVLVLL